MFNFLVLVFSCRNIESRPCMRTHLTNKADSDFSDSDTSASINCIKWGILCWIFFQPISSCWRRQRYFSRKKKNQHLLVRNVIKTSEEISTHYFYHGDGCVDCLQTTAEREYVSRWNLITQRQSRDLCSRRPVVSGVTVGTSLAWNFCIASV